MLHTISTTVKRKKKKLVGRGGAKGKTAGRGTKGQKARAGHKMRPQMRDIIKKLPKLRGRGIHPNKAFRVGPTVVNLTTLESTFSSGARITPQTLVEQGVIRKIGGVAPKVKILGTGVLTKSFKVYECEVSGAAKTAIEKAGGTVTLRSKE